MTQNYGSKNKIIVMTARLHIIKNNIGLKDSRKLLHNFMQYFFNELSCGL